MEQEKQNKSKVISVLGFSSEIILYVIILHLQFLGYVIEQKFIKFGGGLERSRRDYNLLLRTGIEKK